MRLRPDVPSPISRLRLRRLSLPALKDLFRILFEVDVLIHSLYPVRRDEMVLSARRWIVLGHLDRIAVHMIHFTNMLATRGNNFHVFADWASW